VNMLTLMHFQVANLAFLLVMNECPAQPFCPALPQSHSDFGQPFLNLFSSRLKQVICNHDAVSIDRYGPNSHHGQQCIA